MESSRPVFNFVAQHERGDDEDRLTVYDEIESKFNPSSPSEINKYFFDDCGEEEDEDVDVLSVKFREVLKITEAVHVVQQQRKSIEYIYAMVRGKMRKVPVVEQSEEDDATEEDPNNYRTCCTNEEVKL